MFGTYRLILALTVALSHVGFSFRGVNPGQWAVVCFYVLSGFLMHKQFYKLAPIGGIRAFYLDRFLRIYPIYFVSCILCVMATSYGWLNALINFCLLPLNYDSFLNVQILVGQSWSLACEIQFYLTVPFLATAPTRTLRILLALSLSFFACSVILPEPDFWGYRCLPGIIFTFVSGMMVSRSEWATLRICYGIAFVLLLIFSTLKLLSIRLPAGIHINVCSGYLVAIPATSLLAQLSPEVAWDQFLGPFSYPLFLIHGLVLDFCRSYFSGETTVWFIVLSLLASGALVVLVEKPFDLIRYRVRKWNISIPKPTVVGSSDGPSRI